MKLIRIGRAVDLHYEPEVGSVYNVPSDPGDRDQLQPNLILRGEETGQSYLLVHDDDSPIWELRPIG